MVDNYNLLLGFFKSGINRNENPPTSLRRSFSFKTMLAFAFLFLLIPKGVLAQSTANYAFTTNATGSLALDSNANAIDMSAGTTQLVGAGLDDTSSALTSFNLGTGPVFDFYFQGTKYTQFGVSDNGILTLGVVPATSLYALPNAAIATISAFANDMRTGTNGKVEAKVIGTAPNRTLVVQWTNIMIRYSATAAPGTGTWQVRLYESSGNVEYAYGAMTTNASTPSAYYVGFSNNTTVNNVVTVNTTANTASTSATVTSNTYTASSTITQLNSAADGARRIYKFTPPTGIPSDPITFSATAVSALGMTVNWIDNSVNEGFFTVGRSLAPAGPFTIIGSVNSTTVLAIGSPYSLAQTGLVPGTTYYYEIKALNESGYTSSALTGNQATTAAGTITSTGTGNWSAPGTWSTGVVPTSADNVTIAAGHIVTEDVTAASAYTLNISGDLVYTATTARTLTVVSDVTINAGGSFKSAASGTVTTHSLVLGGSLVNNGTLDFSTTTNLAGATIVFNTAGTANFTLGAGSITNLRNAAGVTLTKGTNITSVLTFNPGGTLTVQGANALGFLVVSNGLFKLDGTNVFSNPLFATAGYTIASTGGVWLNNTNATIVGLAGSPTQSGLLRMTAGTYNVGTSAGNSMSGATTSSFIIEGGTMNFASRLNVTSAGASFNMSAGTINISTLVAGNTGASASFGFTSATSVFTMSGGTINLVNASTGGTPVDWQVSTTAPAITGGTLNVGTAATATKFTFTLSGATPGLVIDNTTNNKTATCIAAVSAYGDTNITNGASLVTGAFTFTERGATLTNNGILNATGGTLNMLTFAVGFPQTITGNGTVTGNFSSISIQNTAGVTITHTNQLPTLRVNLFQGVVTGSGKITIGTGLALATVVQIGSAGLLTPGGSFDASPTWNLGTGTLLLTYQQESVARTTGFEVPPTRTTTTMTVNNSNGLILSGGNLEATTTLTLTSGNVTTNAANVLSLGNAATVGTLTGGSATSYINGPFSRSIANGNTNATYILYPVGKAAYTPISLAPATTAISVFKAESFSSNSGTTDGSITALSATQRWEAPLVSGTFTNMNVKLADAAIVNLNIPVQAPTAAGVYTSAFGSTAAFTAGTPNFITSNTPVLAAAYTGFLSYANSNACVGTPAPGATIASSSTICAGSSVTLSVTTIPTGSGVTYQWQSSPDNVTYTDIPTATASTYVASPTSATWYQSVVTCTAGPASGTSTPIQITFSNQITGTTPGSVCGQGTVNLAATASVGATVKWYDAASAGNLVGSGPSFITPSLTVTTPYYAAAETATPGIATLGSGATSSATVAQSFFPGSWGGAKTQYIIKASELRASGLGAGPITSLGFEPTTSGQTYQGFFVNLGLTSASTAPSTTFIATGLSQVYAGTEANDGFTPLAGSVNTLTFGTGTGSTPTFVWDGNSNIVVSISWSRVPSAATSNASSMKVDDVGFVSAAYRQRDNLTPALMLAETSVNTTSNFRPKFLINGQLVCSSPRVAVTATVTTPPVFTLSGNPATICAGQSSTAVTITAGSSDYDTYVWSPATGVTGNPTIGWVFNPATTTTYTLTASQSGGSLCATTATVVVTVNQTPSAITVIPSSAIVCADAIQALTASGGVMNNVSILSENFNGANAWTTVNNSTGGTPALAAWTLRPDGYVYTTSTWHSNDNSQFYLTNGDAAGSGSTSATLLQSPAFSTTNFTSVELKFFSHLYDPTPASTTGKVQASLDGTVWTDLQTLTPTSINTPGSFTQITVALTAPFINKPTVYVRFNYAGVWRYFWGIDNVSITGTQSTVFGWSPITNLYTDAAATIPYVGTDNTAVVYFKSGTAGGPTTYTVTSTGLNTCASTATVDVTVNATAAPTGTAAQTFCNTATVADLSATGTGIQWYAAATGGAALASTVALVDGVHYFASQTVSGCESATRFDVTATINVTAVPTGTAAQTFCNTATVADLSATGTGIQWYAASTGGAALASTVALVDGVHYFASQTVSGCESATRFDVTATINVTAVPTGTAAQTFCNTATVADLSATGSGIQWYAAATGGAALASTVALVDGVHYFASQTVSGCESATRFDVTATINVTAVPTGTAAQTFCNTATVADLSATGTGIQWYAASTGGPALASTVALVDGVHYFASQTVSGCESATRFDVTATINVTAAPTGTASQTFCNAGTVADLSATGTGIQWYAAATGGAALASTVALVDGVHYFASQTVSGCESTTRFDVTATINVTAAPTGTAAQTFCNAGTVANLVATGSGIQWYAAATGGAALASTVTLVDGVHYFASQTVSGCESATRLDVTVNVNNTSVPTGSASQTFCNAGTVANLVATGTGVQWYAAAIGGSPLASTDVLVDGAHYFASQTVSGCESATRLDVTVTVSNTPAPTGAAAQTFVTGQMISDIVVTGSNVVWYASSADAATASNPLPNTTLLVDTTTYYATQTIAGCASTSSLAVTVTVNLGVHDFDSNSFTFYPNPVKDILNLSYSQEMTDVKVFNMIGQQVFAKNIHATTAQIDMSAYPNGAYFIQVSSDKATKTIKVIKK